jgi:uncharacterized membrane protein
MKMAQPSAVSKPLERAVAWRMGMTLFALVGALIALYLWLFHLGLSGLYCPVKGCEVVQASSYSSILGIPVATIGFFAFLALFASSLGGVLAERLRPERIVFIVSSLGLLAYVWFTYLELAVIRAVCFWCVVSSLAMLGVWITSGLALRSAKER